MSDKPGDPTARLFAAFLAARAAFGLAYLGVAVGRWPIPWYFPLERRWEITAAPTGLAMAWFGATLVSLVAALLAGSALWVASARGPIARALGRTLVVLAIARAGGLVLLVDFAYFGWTLSHQTPKPIAEPCPR